MSAPPASRPAARPPWRRWLEPRYVWQRSLHNLLAKILALLVAVTLWFVATADRRANVEQGYDVPVTVRDTTGDRGEGTRAASSLNPATVRVILSGRPDRLRELNADNIEAIVDVTGVPEGSFTQPVTVLAPSGTVVSRRTPARVQGFLDTQVSRTLPVNLSVTPADGSSLPRYGVTPAEVTVRGPGRTVSAVRRVVTSPQTLAAGAQREANLIALDGSGEPVSGVTLSPATVTARRVDTGTLPVKTLPVVLSAPPSTLRVTSAQVQPQGVRVVGPPAALAALRELSGRVTYRAGTYAAPVTLTLPSGVQALDNATASLTVQAAPAKPSTP